MLVAVAALLVSAGPARADHRGIKCYGGTGSTYSTCGWVWLDFATRRVSAQADIDDMPGSSKNWRYGVDNVKLWVKLNYYDPWVLDQSAADSDGPFYPRDDAATDVASTGSVPCENFYFRASWHYTKVSPAGTITASGTHYSDQMYCLP